MFAREDSGRLIVAIGAVTIWLLVGIVGIGEAQGVCNATGSFCCDCQELDSYDPGLECSTVLAVWGWDACSDVYNETCIVGPEPCTASVSIGPDGRSLLAYRTDAGRVKPPSDNRVLDVGERGLVRLRCNNVVVLRLMADVERVKLVALARRIVL